MADIIAYPCRKREPFEHLLALPITFSFYSMSISFRMMPGEGREKAHFCCSFLPGYECSNGVCSAFLTSFREVLLASKIIGSICCLLKDDSSFVMRLNGKKCTFQQYYSLVWIFKYRVAKYHIDVYDPVNITEVYWNTYHKPLIELYEI